MFFYKRLLVSISILISISSNILAADRMENENAQTIFRTMTDIVKPFAGFIVSDIAAPTAKFFLPSPFGDIAERGLKLTGASITFYSNSTAAYDSGKKAFRKIRRGRVREALGDSVDCAFKTYLSYNGLKNVQEVMSENKELMSENKEVMSENKEIMSENKKRKIDNINKTDQKRTAERNTRKHVKTNSSAKKLTNKDKLIPIVSSIN
jgi:hypothetical protein